MKASTLFGLTIALFLAMGVLVGARYLGYFDAAAPVEKKAAPEPHMVLVPAHNLFKGMTASSTDVRVRKLADTEADFYEKNKDRLLPPIEGAVEARVLAKHVTAGQALLEEHFEKQALPEAVSERLDAGMRSVHLELPKDRASGGLIRVGEHVDVLLTSTIHADHVAGSPLTATAPIARSLKVIVKRDNLWTVMQGVPGDKPANYILQANPYRVALLEYARLKGIITLVPTAMTLSGKSGKEPLSDPDSKEYRDEDKRVSEFVNNEHIISDADLERIFNISPRLIPVAAAPPPTTVEMMLGLRVVQTTVVRDGVVISRQSANAQGIKLAPDASAGQPSSELVGASPCVFAHPDGPGPEARSGCKSCGKKK